MEQLHSRAFTLRISQDMYEKLVQNRRDTGVPVSEFCRRAILLALYADRQSAGCDKAKREPAQVTPSHIAATLTLISRAENRLCTTGEPSSCSSNTPSLF